MSTDTAALCSVERLIATVEKKKLGVQKGHALLFRQLHRLERIYEYCSFPAPLSLFAAFSDTTMSTFNYSPINGIPINHQPQASVVNLGSLDLKQQPISSAFPLHEKSFDASLEDGQYEQNHHCEHHHGRTSSDSEHHDCHNNRMKQLFWPAMILVVLALGGLFAWSCMYGSWSDWGVDNLVGRAVTDSTTATTGSNAFTNKKLYLIVIFVGLLVVLILGIMLTACCCKGSFKNPLCCPCYLCACCGGLACLECIGCGLCAEGVAQM